MEQSDFLPNATASGGSLSQFTGKVGSPEINKVIRKIVSPILKSNGLSKSQGRNYFGWHGDVTWVFTIRAVGSYFSDVTGWPPMSISVPMGVYYPVIPSAVITAMKQDASGKPLPMDYQCHFRSSLTRTLDQSPLTSVLKNPAERQRTDLWWIESNGNNVDEVLQNVAEQVVNEALPWFTSFEDPASVLNYVEGMRDCYDKFLQATYVAHYSGNTEKFELYRKALIKEAERIDYVKYLPDFCKPLS